MQDLLSFSHTLANESGKIISGYFRRPFDVETKTDATPVTLADRSVEARLRELIEHSFPEDGILGEEFGPKETQSGRIWVIDPIDGTKSFITGRPTFGTLIALWEGDTPLLGLIDQPILKERWIGTPEKTLFNGTPTTARRCQTLKEARIGCTSPSQTSDIWPRFYKQGAFALWGGDCYAYGLLANGGLDIVVESGLAPYDFAALVPIVQGAGGWMGDWEGNPLTLDSEGKTLAVGNPFLREEALKLVL